MNQKELIKNLKMFRTEAVLNFCELMPYLHPQTANRLRSFIDSYEDLHFECQVDYPMPRTIIAESRELCS